MKKIDLILFLFVSFFTLNNWAQRIGFADEKWKTIKTEHFDIIFSAEQQDLGLYYADVAEKAYQNLESVFTERPWRTVLVINDKTDAANGYATRIPYPLIMAYSVQINDHESLSESGEWARELITHEMTHILQLEPALGFYKFLRPVFGSIVAPNLLLPLWWKEGMAVELETRFSNRGRLRSIHQDAALRAIHLDNKLFSYTLASANEVLPSWPFGNRPYLFGSLLFSFIAKNKKTAALNQLTTLHGEQLPYLITTPVNEMNEASYDDLYDQTLSAIKINIDQQVQALDKIVPTKSTVLPIEGQTALQPIYSTTNKLLAFIENKEGDPEITIKNNDGTFVHGLKNRPTGQINSLVFHPTLPQIYFAKIDRLNSKETFSDIHVYDISTDTVTPVTRGQRARDLRFSEDGSQIVFISTFRGKTQLKILSLDSKNIQSVAESNFDERYSSPLFWNNSEILFIKKQADGENQLQKFDFKTKVTVAIPLKYKNINFLRKFASQLYFTSSENGVFNIYSSTDLKTALPVTHVKTGLWSFALDAEAKNAWATMMSSDGFKIAYLELSPMKEKLPLITNKLAEHYEYKEKPFGSAIINYEDYSAAGYLWPQYWIPFISTTSTSNGVFVQAQTSGADPIKIHQYSLLANYQTDINKTGFIGSYLNSSFAVPFQVGAVQSNQAFGNVDQVVETKTNYISLLPDVFQINKNLSFLIGLQQQETYFNTRTKHWGPFTQISYSSYDQNIFQISPEDGIGLSLRAEKQQNIEGSVDYNKVIATFLKYHSKWLPKHNTIMLRLNALVTFEPILSRFGSSNASAFAATDTLIPQFVLRGYKPNQFFGRSLWTINTEYRFPISRIDKGSVTPAFFMKRLSAAVVADGLGVYKENPRSRLNESYWSAGVEVKLETTLGYVLPLNIILGGYYPFSPLNSEGPQFAFGLQLGGF